MEVHVVSHTHWDREWYHPAGRFRQRLVALVDELLDDPPPAGESFLLDGQGIVLEDYLAVRPERRERVAVLLRDGRLEAGPWYVLADELIPSGEALVRNLLAGRAVLRTLGAAAPPVLYSPDAFGHPAALPELARGFGIPVVIAWRGFGSRRWPDGDTFDWCAPSGASAVFFHLPRSGYEFGASLPEDDDGAAERWRRMRQEIVPRSTTGVLLVQNGADHHARQLGHRRAIAALLRAAAPDDEVRPSSMRQFATALIAGASRTSIPRIAGELRDSYGYTWTLQGTFATRAHQKRGNARVERFLLREAEPWAALARRHGAVSRRELTAAAWRALLQAHPHDTLCGCSIDEVAGAMDARLADARAQGEGIARDALADLLGHDPVAAHTRPREWKPIVIIRNRAARSRGGVVELTLRRKVADVPVGPGSGVAPATAPDERTPVALGDGVPLQELEARRAFDLVESPRHYPDNDLVDEVRAVAWVEPVPGLGLVALPQREADPNVRRRLPPNPVRARGKSLENGRLKVAVDGQGNVALEDHRMGVRIDSLFVFDDRVDLGDLYTPSLRDPLPAPRFAGARIVHRGPLRGAVRTRWTLGAARRSRGDASFIEIDVVLDAGAPFVRLELRGENHGTDHRLRIGFRTLVADAAIFADAAFGPLRRLPLALSAEETRTEHAPPTAPLHRYVSLFGASSGATLFSDGLAEYEADREGIVWVTLLRAVGELSRNDLPERPGHAGWPAPTPAAQSLGPFDANVALALHGPHTPETVHAIEWMADDVLLPVTGETLRSALAVPDSVAGVELDGEGLAFSALKESEDGQWTVVRCVNLLEQETKGWWRVGFPLREARRARLDETPLAPCEISGDRVRFTAGPREVVTLLLR